MEGVEVVTWNVLHRIHAVNWDEPAIAAWPIEVARCEAIAAWISRCDADVICLQEVSGEQLAALRSMERGTVLASPYPRVPAYRRRTETTPLRDPTEYLVTVVRGGDARIVAAEAFPTDGGKGFQRIELATGVTAINTHVSYGDAHREQCARLAAEVSAAVGLTVVCGDFNADRDTCVASLGLTPAIPAEPALPTRPRTQPSKKSQTIDHVFVARGTILDASVLDVDGLSDHNAVRVRLAS